MKYYVIELQDGSVLHDAFNRTQLENGEAASNFYNRCASAAIGTALRVTIMLVDDQGNNVIPPVTFKHDPPANTTPANT